MPVGRGRGSQGRAGQGRCRSGALAGQVGVAYGRGGSGELGRHRARWAGWAVERAVKHRWWAGLVGQQTATPRNTATAALYSPPKPHHTLQHTPPHTRWQRFARSLALPPRRPLTAHQHHIPPRRALGLPQVYQIVVPPWVDAAPGEQPHHQQAASQVGAVGHHQQAQPRQQPDLACGGEGVQGEGGAGVVLCCRARQAGSAG